MVATVFELKSSAVSASYYERDGYYAKNDPEYRQASFWYGGGGEGAGLARTCAAVALRGGAVRLGSGEVEGLTGAAARRADAGADHPSQRLPRAELGDARRHGGVEYPETEEGELLPRLPGAAPDGREGADGGDPGGLHPGRVAPLGRRPGAGDGHVGHLQEPGIAAVRRDRRQDPGLPRPLP